MAVPQLPNHATHWGLIRQTAVVAEASDPVPTARDTELFDLVSVALDVVPTDSVTVTMGWRPEPHWWEVRIQPVRSAAAAVTIGNEIGMNSFNIMVAKTWLELDYPTDLYVLQQIVQAVALTGFEETGFGDPYGRVTLHDGRAFSFGRVHLPWPWQARPLRRRYSSYA